MIYIPVRYLLLLLALSVFQASNGQSIKFQLKRVNACNTNGKIDSSTYWLTDNEGTAYNSQSGVVYLPKPGKYSIFMMTEPYTHLPLIEIGKQDSFTYIYNEPGIVTRAYGMHPIIVYERCGLPLNGYQEDHYSNGNIKIRGNFQQGRIKDSLVTFYSNGVPEKRATYFKKEIVIEEYDSLYHLMSVSHNSNKSYYLTDYKTIEYYSDGKTKLKKSDIGGLILIEEYYPNGQLKTFQTKKYRNEYFDNGKIKTAWKWERKRARYTNDKNRFDFKIYKTTYNENQNMIESLVYERWRDRRYLSAFEFRSSDWIHKWVKYVDGKEIIVAASKATKEYFGK